MCSWPLGPFMVCMVGTGAVGPEGCWFQSPVVPLDLLGQSCNSERGARPVPFLPPAWRPGVVQAPRRKVRFRRPVPGRCTAGVRGGVVRERAAPPPARSCPGCRRRTLAGGCWVWKGWRSGGPKAEAVRRWRKTGGSRYQLGLEGGPTGRRRAPPSAEVWSSRL